MPCITRAVFAFAAMVWFAAPAPATEINTGGTYGAYHQSFCPALSAYFKSIGRNYPCVTSAGTRENIERVLKNPRQFGYGQYDVFVLENTALNQPRTLRIVRHDDARECVFAVTRDTSITSWYDIAGNAARLKFVLPPRGSGSYGTFQFLRSIDRDGLDRARDVTEAADADEAIRRALTADGTVAIFVQFADPDNERFKMIRALGGHLVPVIDRHILSQVVSGQRVYEAQETQVENARWLSQAPRLVTACTPMVLFTGDPSRIAPGFEQRDQDEIVATLRGARADAFMPIDTAFQRVLKRSRELSATSLDRLLDFADRVRDRARPIGNR
jgi:hypothetical protein